MSEVTTLDALRGVSDGLIRKMVSGGAVLLAPITADPVTALTGDGGALIRQTGYKPLGRIAKDGAPTFTPESTEEIVETWGELEPSREDTTSSKLNITVTLQDTRKETLELATRQNLDELKAAANGEFAIVDNPTPGTLYYRALFIAADGTGDDAFYFGRFLPRLKLKTGVEDWNPTNAITFPLEGTAFKDNTLGFSSKRFFGGPGALRRLAAMGISKVG